jgi:hypothetical protein
MPMKNKNQGPKNGGPGGKGGKGGNKGGRRDNNDSSRQEFKMKEIFFSRLENTLFENAYCLEGYIKIESYFEKGLSQFKGQCEEKASSLDRKRFPNQS